MKAILRLLPLYAGVGLSALATIISIPVMISSQGLDQWAAIGIGQTVGSVIAPLAGFGWAVTGPAAVARADNTQRARIYTESLRLRAAGILPILGLGGGIAAAIATGDQTAAIVGMVSSALAAADASFFYLGTGQLWHVFWLTFAPRFIGTAAGCVAILAFGADAIAVPWGMTAGVLLGIIVATFSIRGSHAAPTARPRSLPSLLREQSAPIVSGVAGSIFLLIPTALVSWLAPSALNVFVLYDRLTKQVLTLGAPLFTYLQGWVPRGSTVRERHHRMNRAFQSTAAAAVVALLAFLTLGDFFTRALSTGVVSADAMTSLAMGLVVSLSLGESLIARIALIVTDRVRAMSLITVIGSVIGAISVALLASTSGATGALIGIAIGMFLRVALGIVIYRKSPVM